MKSNDFVTVDKKTQILIMDILERDYISSREKQSKQATKKVQIQLKRLLTRLIQTPIMMMLN